jgi:hypothetical protein
LNISEFHAGIIQRGFDRLGGKLGVVLVRMPPESGHAHTGDHCFAQGRAAVAGLHGRKQKTMNSSPESSAQPTSKNNSTFAPILRTSGTQAIRPDQPRQSGGAAKGRALEKAAEAGISGR